MSSEATFGESCHSQDADPQPAPPTLPTSHHQTQTVRGVLQIDVVGATAGGWRNSGGQCVAALRDTDVRCDSVISRAHKDEATKILGNLGCLPLDPLVPKVVKELTTLLRVQMCPLKRHKDEQQHEKMLRKWQERIEEARDSYYDTMGADINFTDIYSNRRSHNPPPTLVPLLNLTLGSPLQTTIQFPSKGLSAQDILKIGPIMTVTQREGKSTRMVFECVAIARGMHVRCACMTVHHVTSRLRAYTQDS